MIRTRAFSDRARAISTSCFWPRGSEPTSVSGFAANPTLLKADSLIVCGGTTSGCVRATVLDAFSENLRCAVVADGCFDRVEVSHAMNLVDMQTKYADVIDSDEAMKFMAGLQSGMFDLPGVSR